MVKVKIYIEGGAPNDKLADILFRKAWSTFFKAAGLQNNLPKCVPGYSRANTFDSFVKSSPSKDEVVLLLIDSEIPIKEGNTVWQHLQNSGLNKPVNTGEDRVYLMVQIMETWLLADIDALEKYFGKGFKRNKIQAWPMLEEVSKESIVGALSKATADCSRQYGKDTKGKISFELLEKIDPRKVIEKCPQAKRLIDFLSPPR